MDLWNPDSILRSVYIDDIIWVQQMRWANQLWEQFVRSYYVLPQLSFVLSTTFIALVSVMVCDIFKVSNKGMFSTVVQFVAAAQNTAEGWIGKWDYQDWNSEKERLEERGFSEWHVFPC